MKLKLFSSLALVAMMFAGTSCSSEEVAPVTGESTVTLSVTLPDGIQSRAFGDGSTAQKLTMLVLDENNKALPVFNGDAVLNTDINLSKQVNLRLAAGKTYKVVCWAAAEGSPYTFNTSDFKVSANYEGAKTSDEKLDAFYAVQEITVQGNTTETVKLYRPFAQLNIGTNDLAAAKAAGFDAKSVTVTVPTYKSLDLLSGAVEQGDPQAVTFEANALPTGEAFPKTGYDYLSMNYLLMSTDKQLVDLEFTVKAADGSIRTIPVTAVPVQRNYRTNIYGSLLTNSVNINVEIIPDFNEPGYEGEKFEATAKVNGVEYPSFAAAVEAVNAGDAGTYNVVLQGTTSWATGDAGSNANKCFTNPASTVNLDLNGKSLTMTGSGGFVNAAKMNITNGTIVDKTAYKYENGETAWEFTYLEFEGGEYAFDNVTFNNSVMFKGTKATATNCIFKGIATLTSNQSDEYCLWIGKGDVTLKGCKISNGYRGVKAHNGYGTEDINIVIDGCEFFDLAGKAAVLTDRKVVSCDIKDCIFRDVQAGGQGMYAYQSYTSLKPKVSNCRVVFTKAQGLVNFAKQVNEVKMSYSDKTLTFELGSDIDLVGINWEPIGQTGVQQFQGVFDGMNYTINNLTINKVSTEAYVVAGFFGWLNDGANIKNVKFEGAKITASGYAGVVAGYIENHVTPEAQISNCHVNNATISSKANGSAKGAKVGGIIGMFTDPAHVTNCSVSNTNIDAARDAGQIVGATYADRIVNCTATNVNVTANGTGDGSNVRNELIGRVL